MQKLFLEMKEELTEEEVVDGIQSVFIRVEVANKAAAIAHKPNFMQHFAGKSHKDTFHTCNHPNASCAEEEI